MLRFDSELELETHELGRSLLRMVRSDDAGFYEFQPPVARIAHVNPFDALRERLIATSSAIQGLQDQVLLVFAFVCIYGCRFCALHRD
jgi:hypothetical protein